jgi:hypothetical protein
LIETLDLKKGKKNEEAGPNSLTVSSHIACLPLGRSDGFLKYDGTTTTVTKTLEKKK